MIKNLIFLSLAVLLIMAGCQQKNKEVAQSNQNICVQMMDNRDTANMMMECMMNMASKDSSMQGSMYNKMMDNKQMMGMMIDSMIERCKKDTGMCSMMCGKMMDASHMKGMMKDMMK